MKFKLLCGVMVLYFLVLVVGLLLPFQTERILCEIREAQQEYNTTLRTVNHLMEEVRTQLEWIDNCTAVRRATCSYYADFFEGRTMANGKPFRQTAPYIAHKTLPFGTVVLCWSDADSWALGRITDRGPYISGREFDLSKVLANKLGMLRVGVMTVDVLIFNPYGVPKNCDAGAIAPALLSRAPTSYPTGTGTPSQNRRENVRRR